MKENYGVFAGIVQVVTDLVKENHGVFTGIVQVVTDLVKENYGVFAGIVQVVTDLVKEGGAREHHGELAGVVGVVVPGVVLDVPGVESTREPHHPVPLLPPHSGTQHADR